MPNAFEASEQLGRPDSANKLDNGRTNAQKGSKTPSAPSFKAGPLETPASGGSFKERTQVNDLQAKGFKQRGPSGV